MGVHHLSPEKIKKLVKSATYASVSVASFLILVKLLAWGATGSVSLQATLFDSLLDALASGINLVAVRQALRPADRDHRFGHGKIEAIAALGQSIFIALSGGFLIYEAVHRFFVPYQVQATGVGLFVMGIAMVFTLALLLYQNYVVKMTHSAAIQADSIHYRSDLLINVGVIVALVGVSWFQFPLLDPVIGLMIAVYILYTAWVIIKQAFHMLLDREWPDEARKKIIEIVLSHPKVTGFHDLRTRSSGMDRFIQLHLEMDGRLSLTEAHDIAEDVIDRLKKTFPKTEIIAHQDPNDLQEQNRDPFPEDLLL